MHTKNNTSLSRISPKVIAVILIATLLILLSGLLLFRSVFQGNVLTTLTYGNFRFELCGTGSLSQIKVYLNDERTASIKTASVGNAETDYGVTVSDVDYDGFPDLVVIQELQGEDQCYAVWTWNPSTGTYRSAEALIGAKNLSANDEHDCLISHRNEKRYVGKDENRSYYNYAEVYSIFRTYEGELIEYARYEFIYYEKSDLYAYQIFRLNEDKKQLSAYSEDKWLTPTEAESFSLSDAMNEDLALRSGN